MTRTIILCYNKGRNSYKEVLEMRLMDKVLRKDPQRNRGWLRAFRKARLGWGSLNLHKEYIKLNGEPEVYFLGRAEEYLMQAKQILAYEGLINTELEKYIDEGLEQINRFIFQNNEKRCEQDCKGGYRVRVIEKPRSFEIAGKRADVAEIIFISSSKVPHFWVRKLEVYGAREVQRQG